MSSKDSFNDNTTADNELPVSVQECIKNIIKNDGYEIYKVDTKLVSTGGGNYLASLYEIDIKGKTVVGEKETNLFVKATKKVSESFDDIFSVGEVYLTEGFFYKDLCHVFKSLEDEAMVPVEERYNMIRSYEQTDVEAIILENLAKKGFKTLYRMDVPSLKFIELCMQEIAKFHAFSYILQERDPDYLGKKIASRKSVINYGDKWQELAENMSRIIIKCCDGDVKKKLEDFIPVLLKKYPQYYQDQESSIGCLCHGDFRVNNTLSREMEGEIEKVILIDYQLLHYGCPVNDFIYFIYTCTDCQFRSQHLEHIKNVYHNALGRFLQYFDIDAEEVYPRKEFERILDVKKDLGLMIGLIFYPFLFVPESEVPDVSKDDFSVVKFEVDPRAQERILEIVEELWG